MSDGKTIGTVVGGVLGFVTGGIGFVAAGAALGGALGGMVDPASTDSKPDRLADLKVSVSSYGAGISETWGNDVPTGTWIWSTDIQEVPQYYGSGGKGGGEEGPSSYFYMVHGLVCLGHSPPPGVQVALRKVYKDGELKWDASYGLSVGQALATEENPFVGIQLLDGNQDQLPPAFIELWEGIGNAPGYRGLITILVVGLETPGGRIPQLSFEICVGSTLENLTLPMLSFPGGNDQASGIVLKDSVYHYDFEYLGYNKSLLMNVYNGMTGGIAQVNKFDLGVIDGDGIFKFGYRPFPLTGGSENEGFNTLGRPHVVWVYDQGGATRYEYIDLQTGVIMPIFVFDTADPDLPGRTYGGRAAQDNETGTWAFLSVSLLNVSTGVMLISGLTVKTAVMDYPAIALYFSQSLLFSLTHDGDTLYLERRNVDGSSSGSMPALIGPTLANLQLSSCALMVSGNGIFVYVARGGSGGADQGSVYQVSLDTQEWVLLAGSTGQPPTTTTQGINSFTFFACPEFCITGPDFTNSRYNLTRFKVVTPQEADVADVIASQSARVGLADTEIDVSTIDDTFWGYTFNKSPSSARSNIAPLLTYAAAACVEEDGLIRYFHRADHASVATITYAELGCVEAGQEPGDAFPLVRMNAAECPRSLTVSYLNPSFDYQVSTEMARRLATDSNLDETVELGISMSPDRAASIAHRLLYERWVAQTTRSLVVSRKYAFLSAGDVVQVEYPAGTLSNWILSSVTDTGAVIEAEGMPADSELLLQTVTGSSGYLAQQIPSLAPQTRLQLLDIPILQDGDNNAGMYAAMEGYGDGWPGAALYAGPDSGAMEAQGEVNMPAVIGFTEDVLGPWALNMVDEQNVLTVNIGEDALSTVTRDAMLSGAVNIAAIGAPGRWEIVKFRQATDLGGGRYTLTGFLRGFRGTEQNRANHGTGDFFVVLSGGGVLRTRADNSIIGQSQLYRAVTKGRSFNSTESRAYTNFATGLKPFAPTNLSKSITAGDITLAWVRRTRLSENWLRGIVPLGEASEAYEVVIYSDNTFTTVKRIIATTTRSALYTSAQQIADFGINPTTLYVRVYQISDVVGRGNALQASI